MIILSTAPYNNILKKKKSSRREKNLVSKLSSTKFLIETHEEKVEKLGSFIFIVASPEYLQ